MSLRIVKPLSKIAPSSNATDSTPAWVNGTNYTLGTQVQVSGTGYTGTQFGLDPGGIYQCLTAGISTVSPPLDPVRWGFVSYPNMWKMFDTINSSQTIFPTQISASLVNSQVVNTLALFNLDASSIQVKVTDYSTGTVVMDQTFSLQSPPILANWYNYFFDPIVNKTELLASLPSYRTTILNVKINQTGDAKCGTMIVGYASEIASGIQYGASLGMTDYSRKEKDIFGTYNFIQRDYSKLSEFTCFVPNGSVDAVIQYLTQLRATPTLFIGDDAFTSTAIFGVYNDYKTTVNYPTESVLTLSLEGLT